MEIIFSKQVLFKIDEYALALTIYPISTQRIIEKVENLKKSLLSLDTFMYQPSICMSKDLGQEFTSDGNPIYKNLRRFNYKDESGFQWSFACLYNNKANRITIVKMMASNQIRERVENLTRPILEFWERLKRV